jgi:hypothetical protein
VSRTGGFFKTKIHSPPRIEKSLRPNPESVGFLLDQIAIDDPRIKQLSEKDHGDLSLLVEIQQSGFLDKLYKQ